MIDDPEEFAWQQLEAKQNKTKAIKDFALVQDWEAIAADQAMTIAMLRDDLAQQSKPWVSLSDRDITGAAHTEARYPVSILETTDSGLCMQFSETGEWHASDKHGDFMKVNSFLMSFAKAVEAELRSKNT